MGMMAFFHSATTCMPLKHIHLSSAWAVCATWLCLCGPALTWAEEAAPLAPLDVHGRTSLTIVEQLRHNHYLRKTLDDTASSEVFDNYLEALDGARVYFTAADVAAMEKHRHELDDALKRGNLGPAFDMFNRHQRRLIDRFEYLLAKLEDGVEALDFGADETLEVDRKDAPWPADEAALDALWDKRLKAAALNMRLNGKPDAEIQELLTKRYRNRLKQARQTKSEDAFGIYVNAFTTAYDPHTRYFSPRVSQNFNINMSLSLEGIGAVLRSEDEYTSVVRLVPAGPAAKTGKIKPADRIISVGQGERGPLIDVVGWRLDDVVELIRGPKGSKVRLEIVPDKAEGQAAKVVQITRNTVKLEEQAARKKLLTLRRGGHDYRIGVIEIPTFYVDFKALKQGDPSYRSTTGDVARLVRELEAEGMDGLVIDLRNNGGGSLQEADKLTGLFIKSGPTVQVRAARKRANVYADDDESLVWDGPLAVMVNRLSASASEIFAGAIQDYQRGVIVGGRTFGKGTVQTLVPLNRGQLKITAAKFYRISGQSTQNRGVLPDIEFPDLYDVEHIGESSLEDAMPWDDIRPAAYPRSNNIRPALGTLRAQHAERTLDNPDFVYLRTLADRIRQDSENTELSLNEAERRRQKAEEDAWRLEVENTLRLAKGLSPLKDLDELEAEDDPADEDEADDPTNEAVLAEAGEVLLDLIGFRHQVAMIGDASDVPASVVAPALSGESASRQH
ncbi:MAG: tail-specific protease [Gammaproteobacteria bacterium]|nr:tail-specific protease [Gammaproteobacteria bacterium]